MLFKEMKTSELTEAALDWAVAKCVYDSNRYNYGSPCFNSKSKRVYKTEGLKQIGVFFAPSADWKQGGPIIERERISLEYTGNIGRDWFAKPPGNPTRVRKQMMDGPTPLIAAMRCYVAIKLGDTVSIPAELLEVN